MKTTRFFLTLFCSLLLLACGDYERAGNVPLKQDASATAAGVSWSVPERWQAQGARMMRIATYLIAAAEGDTEQGECAVFYFGSGQGGDVDMNIRRWGSQFEGAGEARKTTSEVAGLNVTRVEIAGTYLAPGGPMMESQGRKENFRLLGAIVEAPEGSVFFKLTGPANTVAAAEREFDAMIQSITK